jgi:hypothetical protein
MLARIVQVVEKGVELTVAFGCGEGVQRPSPLAD